MQVTTVTTVKKTMQTLYGVCKRCSMPYPELTLDSCLQTTHFPGILAVPLFIWTLFRTRRSFVVLELL